MAVLIVSAIFALVMIGLSIRANARFRQERKLPMQWRLSRWLCWKTLRGISLGNIRIQAQWQAHQWFAGRGPSASLLPKIGGTHLSTDFFNTITIRAAFQFGELVRTSRSSSQLHALPCDLCAGAVQCYRDDPNAEARAGGDAVTVPDLYWRRVRGGPCFPALVDRKEPGPKLNSMSSCSHANMAV